MDAGRPRTGAVAALLFALAAPSAAGEEPRPASPYGSLLRAFIGDTLERRYQIALVGFAHISAAASNHDIEKTLLPQGRGRGLQPQGGLIQDEGLNLNHVGVVLCRGMGCMPTPNFAPNRNVLSRITPLPGPPGEHVIVDWNVTAIYGEDVAYWRTKGFDDWRSHAGDRHKPALSQWFLDLYLPVWQGVSVLVGSFHSPAANEIGYAFARPNWFSTRTYAFAAAPAKHVGVLAQAKLPVSEARGVASLGLGVTGDWNSIELGSGDHTPGFILTARWRSPDMKTWLDLEAFYGNGEDDFGDAVLVDGVLRPRGGGSQYLVISSRDALLARFFAYFSIIHEAGERLRFAMESVYGHQEGGDVVAAPFAVTRDAAVYGINGAVRYTIREHLHLNARAEWFADENAANVLWAVTGAGGGDVLGLTLNLAWEPHPLLLIRPELKYDVYDGKGHLFAAGASGLATEDTQFLATLNLDLRF